MKLKKSHLVIGDAHATPEVSNRRFEWLGNYIIENKPDVIVDIGDWGDFNSIGTYAKGTRDAWGSTFAKDVDAYRDASRKAFGRIKGCKHYRPTIIRCGGNHEEGRIARFVNENPEFEGTISIRALHATNFGAQYTPFKDVRIQDGIAYSHYFYDKDSRYPIISARTVLQRKFHSSVWGHTHIRDMAEGVASDGRRVIALNVGCFLDPEQKLSYAGPQGNARWWSGIVHLHDVDQGSFDPEFISVSRLQAGYS